MNINTVNVPDYILRMEQEDKELGRKIHAGRGFLNKGVLNNEQEVMLHKQLSYMYDYRDTLKKRITYEYNLHGIVQPKN